MKTLFTLAMASALSFSALAANEDLKELSTVNSNYKKINVTLKGGVGDAKISIIDQNGKNLNNRKVHVKDESVVVPYDMNNLPAGEYQVRITTEDEEVSYTVATMEKPIPVADLPLMAYGKAKDNNTINLSVIGLVEPGVEVKIISSDSGKVIFEEKIDQPDAFKKDYKLKSMNAEDVYVELTDALGRTKTLFF
ncbi:T9SS type A sorting domain-containing protein [Algoriphagus pacificus]|uniref:Por secretion system C-terminal sorting domain-containing protein n=1 Tax=Algoriphagus pacificus TaxID=2811234 RepID=A0ABS3CH57_9BACT|nr:hypothetical protein [Algoriphagus pacificus]MBN7816428.1 hypothetical protein [Algoriphagus pacificus]